MEEQCVWIFWPYELDKLRAARERMASKQREIQALIETAVCGM
jgi:hypothetical protein